MRDRDQEVRVITRVDAMSIVGIIAESAALHSPACGPGVDIP